jgi:hypothetical protein
MAQLYPRLADILTRLHARPLFIVRTTRKTQIQSVGRTQSFDMSKQELNIALGLSVASRLPYAQSFHFATVQIQHATHALAVAATIIHIVPSPLSLHSSSLSPSMPNHTVLTRYREPIARVTSVRACFLVAFVIRQAQQLARSMEYDKQGGLCAFSSSAVIPGKQPNGTASLADPLHVA